MNMRYWNYRMHGRDPDHAKNGDMRSWFMFYRWEKQEETFLPFDRSQASVLETKKEMPAVGDVIWICLDYEVFGSTTVTGVVEDCANERWEIWYDGAEVKAVPEERREYSEL